MPAKKQSKKATSVRDLKPQSKTSTTKGGAANPQARTASRSPAAAFGNPPGAR